MTVCATYSELQPPGVLLNGYSSKDIHIKSCSYFLVSHDSNCINFVVHVEVVYKYSRLQTHVSIDVLLNMLHYCESDKNHSQSV